VYPELTAPLLGVLAVAAVLLTAIAVRAPVLRRLALRQVARRPTEAVLVVLGSVLGTAIIVGSLVVGDTLGFSVRQVAYHTLGPVDERVLSTSAVTGDQVDRSLRAGLAGSRDVDGVLSGVVQQTAALRRSEGHDLAEPRVLAFDLDLAEAATFGSSADSPGLSGPAPAAGHVVVNEPFARALDVVAGDAVDLYLEGRASTFVVDRVVAGTGLAGTGLGSTQNRNVFLPHGTLAATTSSGARWVTWLSNRGGTETGSPLTDEVSRQVRRALGPLDAQVVVETPKRDVLRQAKTTGDSLGALFLMIGSFSIIAGALLLVNVFVMLAEERKAQLGMLRASGLRRSHLVAAFSLEGAVYAVVAAGLGLLLGIAVGRAVALVAARIFTTWSVDGSGLDVTFAVTRTSLVNGVALGMVVSLLTVLVTSVRISRFNVIAAIRDLETTPSLRARSRRAVAGGAAAGLLGVLSVPVVAASSPVGTFVLPALAIVCAGPLLGRVLGRRRGASTVATAVLAWTLLVNLLRPKVYDTPSMVVFVVLGTLLAFSAVALLSENQSVLVRPLRRLIERPTPGGLALRLAVANPVAKRFRTGATLVMYTLVTLVLVLLMEIAGVMRHGIDDQVVSATAGYDVRVDFSPGTTVDTLRSSAFAEQVREVTPLVSARAMASDPGRRTKQPLDALVVGVPAGSTRTMPFEERMPGLESDDDVWSALRSHPDYVVVDPFFGATGGPPGKWYAPGDSFAVTDPRSGTSSQKVIAGVLRNAVMFYAPTAPTSFPMITSDDAVHAQFGDGATVTSAFVRAADGADPALLSRELQGAFLQASLVATPTDAAVRRMFEANLAFFQLMQGFLALGLLVGITGLGVVMVRAVRERRRTIGILRALGFPARTIERSFVLESGFVATEGVVLGALLGTLTTWLMYERSAMFQSMHTGFPVLWGTLGMLVAVTVAASLVATVGPARRAARILPALATRVAD
jgi:putative ABC transport system permease protein